ncbi:MAG: fumarate reductase subunit C [Candidatus Contendobacter odensis]|uniref:Fumarate reductase subunit C n=1 Tax=Candidatus Contendibacter odensensis TaxID=1400860 RepID=A0A2G6PFG6_9GAMM|nr:MAG: fumarate reductase subunit C [Candidatus Contendobacter odensis]
MSKPYIRKLSKTGWFLKQPRYMRYMGREVTCIFIGAYTLLLVMMLKSLAKGPEAYNAFLEGLGSPLSILFLLVTLGFALYHSTGWFNVTPKAMPIQRGEEFVPDNIIVGAHYGVWGVVSLGVLILAWVV